MQEQKYEEHLQRLFTNINEWLKFAEAKNFGLLTLNAAILFGFTQIEFAQDSCIKIAGAYIFTPFALFSFLAAILSLFPILTKIESTANTKNWITKLSNFIDKEVPFENIHFYGYLKGIEEAEFESKFLSKTESTEPFTQYEKELATQILYNSRITSIKYQLFKIGAFIFCLGVVISVIALPIICIIRQSMGK